MLVSKLTRDEIPQENYNKLKEFIDTLDPTKNNDEEVGIPQEPEEWYDDSMEEWPEGKGGVDDNFHWSDTKEKFSSGHQGEDDDDIQVQVDCIVGIMKVLC